MLFLPFHMTIFTHINFCKLFAVCFSERFDEPDFIILDLDVQKFGHRDPANDFNRTKVVVRELESLQSGKFNILNIFHYFLSSSAHWKGIKKSYWCITALMAFSSQIWIFLNLFCLSIVLYVSHLMITYNHFGLAKPLRQILIMNLFLILNHYDYVPPINLTYKYIAHG